MMTDKFSLPSWSARNPLGIVALFISLIYAMSAALLGVSIKNLTESNQTILVVFVVVFPFVVLSVFAWLVAKHHRKLYGPGDYRSDEGFLNAASTSPPSALGQRLREEIEQAQRENQQEKVEAKELSDKGPLSSLKGSADPKTVGLTNPPLQNEPEESDPVLRIYAAENLVFQELQREFGGALRRHVSLELAHRRVQLDGVLELKDGLIFVEVKNLFSSRSISQVLRNAKKQFSDVIETARPNVKFLLALVMNYKLTEEQHAEIVHEGRAALGEKFEIRIYSFSDLSHKYGLDQKPKTRLGRV